jgi:hypothetical protein
LTAYNCHVKTVRLMTRSLTILQPVWRCLEVLDGCCGGCPPELGVLLEDLQLASPRSTLDAKSFLDAIFPGHTPNSPNFTDFTDFTDVRSSQMQSDAVHLYLLVLLVSEFHQ